MVWAGILVACAPSQAVDPGLLNEPSTPAPSATPTFVGQYVSATPIASATVADVGPTASTTLTPRPLPTAGPLPGRIDPSPLPQTGEAPDEIVQAAVRAAIAAAGLAEDTTVTVVRDEAVLWPDGSLGCPRPGVMYTQAEVPGYWVELEIAGQRFDYRFGDLDVPIPCER